MYGYMYFSMFSKVDNVRDFLFAFLEIEVYEMTPIIWEATMKLTVPFPESVPIRLKIQSGT